MFLGGVWRRLWPTAIPRYKVLALRPPVVCVGVYVWVCERVCLVSAFWLKSQLQIAAALSHAISEQQKRTPDGNDNVTCCSPSLPVPPSTRVHFSLPTLHEALSCQMCLLFQKGLLHPSEVYAPEIFPVFWWGKSLVAGYFMRPL